MRKFLITGLMLGTSISGFAVSIDSTLKELDKNISIVEINELPVSNTKTVQIKQRPHLSIEEFKKPISLAGKVDLMRAFSILVNEGLSVVFEDKIENEKTILSIQTKSIPQFIKIVCESFDLWCDWDKFSRQVKVYKRKKFTVDFTPEGRVSFAIGKQQSLSGEESTGSGATSSSTGQSGQSTSYQTFNLSKADFIEELKKTFKVPVIASENGFLMFEASPREWRQIRNYFQERQKRQEVVYTEIQLLRIDLKDEFKWGIDWNAITKYTSNSIKNITFGITSNVIDIGDKATIGIVTKGGDTTGIITALSTFGEVHKVDSWYYQMTTGTPIPFRNYQLVRYFTTGTVQGDNTTQTTVEVNEDEVGFRGVLSLYKQTHGYYVDGFIDLSTITDYIEANIGGGTVRAPLIEGKSFRISTKLNNLNRTLIIGGFKVKGIEKTNSGVPYISKIPILGYLFKGKTNLKQNSEFVVLITLKPATYGKTEKLKKSFKKIEKEITDTFTEKVPSKEEKKEPAIYFPLGGF